MGVLDHLAIHLPENALYWVDLWTQSYNLEIKVKKARNRKLGDYRFPRPHSPHKISINKMENSFLFFLTLTHEIAHMHTYSIYKPNTVKPHGKEWKNIFGNMIFDTLEVYPDNLKEILLTFAKNPKAGFFSDEALSFYFQDKKIAGKSFVKDLVSGDLFILQNKEFSIIKKNRTKYLCQELNTHKKYLITGNALVEKK